MNMKKIDGTKKLTIRHFKNLQSALKEDDMLIILVDGLEIGTISVVEFPSIFSSGTLSELEDDQIIDFVSENVMLSINARDYKKWTNPWWASRIFAEEATQMKIDDIKLIFCCEVFKKKKDTGEMYDSTSFSSDKQKQIVEFVNKVRGKLEIQSLLENADVMYRFWYGNESDNDIIGTFEELKQKGVFVV